jgi:hypothetical protein
VKLASTPSLVFVSAVTLACTACAAAPPSGPPAVEPETKPEIGAEASEVRTPPRPPDPADALLKNAVKLPLDEQQRAAVVWLVDDHDRNKAAIKAAFSSFQDNLARQVRAGRIDAAALGADEDAVASAVQALAHEEASVVDRLHALLAPRDRSALVISVRKEQSVRLTAGEMPSGRTADLARMTRLLALDVDQQNELAAYLFSRPRAEAESETQATTERELRTARVLDAFVFDTFDAKTALASPGPPPAEVVRFRLDNKVALMSQLVPMLRPDQRQTLAANLAGSEAPYE